MAASTGSYVQQMLVNCIKLPFLIISLAGRPFERLYASFGTINGATRPPAISSTEIPKSRFRMDNDTSATFVLPDGRKLGYAEYGSPTGKAIFYLHGLPGSRIEAAAFDEMAVTLGARIIAVDRPGYGWSSPHPGRTILDHPKDIEQLAEHLGLEKYGVLGVSGGGPYALASAAALPADKLKAVAMVCGLGPPELGYSGMDWMHWIGFAYGFRLTPGICSWWFSKEPGARVDLSDEKRLELFQKQIWNGRPHEKDVWIVSDLDILRLSVRAQREAFAHGADAAAQDGHLMATDFGFRIEDIRPDLVMQLWYGKQDTSVPLNHGEQIAQRLRARTHLRIKDETHWSVLENWRKEILEDLVRNI